MRDTGHTFILGSFATKSLTSQDDTVDAIKTGISIQLSYVPIFLPYLHMSIVADIPLFIAGQSRDSSSGHTYNVIDPVTETVVHSVAAATAEDW